MGSTAVQQATATPSTRMERTACVWTGVESRDSHLQVTSGVCARSCSGMTKRPSNEHRAACRSAGKRECCDRGERLGRGADEWSIHCKFDRTRITLRVASPTSQSNPADRSLSSCHSAQFFCPIIRRAHPALPNLHEVKDAPPADAPETGFSP